MKQQSSPHDHLTTEERILILETEFPHIKQEITSIWTALTPQTREYEELKTEIIKALGRLESAEKELLAQKEIVKEHSTKIINFDEQYRFLVNARKNINTIFIAIIIQSIFLLSGLITFIFTLTQQKVSVKQEQQQQVNPSPKLKVLKPPYVPGTQP